MTAVNTPVHLVGDVNGAKLALNETEVATVQNDGRGRVSFLAPGASETRWEPIDITAHEPRLVAGRGKQEAFLPEGALRGRQYIFIDEWGPYDFTDVRLFPSRVVGGPRATIQLVGPASPFRMTYATGRVSISPMEGRLPAKLKVEARSPGVHTFTIGIDAGGRSLTAGGTLLSTEWKVTYYGWSESVDPRNGPDAWRRITESEPLDQTTGESLDFVWYGRSPSPNVPRDHFATVAATRVQIPSGRWRVRTISDDGIRVFFDGEKVIDNWTWHGPTEDKAVVDIQNGEHDIHVEHFEIDGHAQLQFHIEPAE
jgi:hypothetical protein